MKDKIVIVTGATNGIGEVTALELARKGATVVLISRSQAKLDEDIARIKAETGNQNLSSIQADLSSLEDIRKAAAIFQEKFQRLDVLVNNAGAVFYQRQETVDGNEMSMSLNHLNYFLLTNLLLPLLKDTAAKTGEARVINVSSAAHIGQRISFNDLQRKEKYSAFDVYGETKLMNILFTFELARRLEGTNVSANALHPGFVKTGFGMNNNGFVKWSIAALQNLLAISPEKGAETTIYLASAPELKGITAKYWEKSQAKQAYKTAYDENSQKQLWQISEKLVSLAGNE